jgi:hypothetical protein
MAGNTLTPSAPLMGSQQLDVSVDPTTFYQATRRMRFGMKTAAGISGLGSGDSVQLRQTGIVSSIEVRVFGIVTFGGTIAGTSMLFDWPHNLVRAFRLSANGQSNLISARGITMKALEFASNPRLDDAGITKTVGAAAVSVGTLAMPTDDWGTSTPNALSPGATVAAAGAYTVDLTYVIPVAADPVSLVGAIFAQSQATNLTLDVDWAAQAQITTLGGAATLDASGLKWQATGRAYSIPNVGGRYVVPDLSRLHQVAEYRTGVVQGTNEPVLPGTGAGRQLMRVFTQVQSSGVPLSLNAANFGPCGWAYGGNDVPESYPNGTQWRADIYRTAGADLGGAFGIGLWDFASQFALRDLVDEGATSDLRLSLNLVNAPTNGAVQIAQETLFAAPVGA